MAEWYPLMLNIAGKLCVVFGGGSVAERKTERLLSSGAAVRIVSLALTPGLQAIVRQERVEWRRKKAEWADMEGAFLVFAATDDPGVNRRLAEAAKASGILVNDAGDGENGDFIVPAVLRRGDFVLTASSSGSGPALASRVIRELARRYGPEYAEYAAALRRIREAVKRQEADLAERRKLLDKAAEETVLQEWLAACQGLEPEQTLEWLRSRVTKDSGKEKK